MKQNVMLTIRGRQIYEGQEPDVIEMVTEGTIEHFGTHWDICYEETELTGLAGVITTFRIEPGKVTLSRDGKLRSQMVFEEGVFHESLYQMEFGALMITVCAKQISSCLGSDGGTVDLVYGIDIENCAAGIVDYHLEISRK